MSIDPKKVHQMDQGMAALRDLAEQLSGYREHLTEAGFTREEALKIVVAYQATMLGSMLPKGGGS